MSVFWAVFKRDYTLAFRQNTELLQPVLFCLLVVTLFPLGIGPSPQTLQKVGPGIIWVAALLSSLLALEKLFKQDFQDGSLEQLVLTPYPLPLLALAKVLVHWLASALPLIFAGHVFKFNRRHVLGIVIYLDSGYALDEPDWRYRRSINSRVK